MKQLKNCFFLLLAFSSTSLQASSEKGDSAGTELVKRMYKKFYHGPCKIYTFSQKNTHYRNDSVVGHSNWHEAVEFPDRFRINFGSVSDSNFVVFRNDSVFNYRGGKRSRQRADSSSLLLWLGGMFYRDLPDVLARLKLAGYDLSTLSEQTWNGKPVYVLGAKANDLGANQVWIDKKTFYVLRLVEKMNEKDWMDMRFESHQPWCSGYVETKVSFRRNGKLEQVEEYYDIKKAEKFPLDN